MKNDFPIPGKSHSVPQAFLYPHSHGGLARAALGGGPEDGKSVQAKGKVARPFPSSRNFGRRLSPKQRRVI